MWELHPSAWSEQADSTQCCDMRTQQNCGLHRDLLYKLHYLLFLVKRELYYFLLHPWV